jgi:hypothetical protein
LSAKSPNQYRACTRCGSCCGTHPCALAPDDLRGIANFLGITCTDLFRRYLVLDYTLSSGRKLHYVCPGRFGDKCGTLVDWDWAFKSSPCIFLTGNSCGIEPVKPRGGRTFLCRLVTGAKRNRAVFGKRKAAEAWMGNPVLERLLAIAKAQPSSA